MPQDIQQQINTLLNSGQTNQPENVDDQFILEEEFLTPENVSNSSPLPEDLPEEKKVPAELLVAVEKEVPVETVPVAPGEPAPAVSVLPAALSSIGTRVEEILAPLSSGQQVKVADEGVKEELQDKIKKIELERKEAEVQAEANIIGLGYINLIGLPIVPEALRLIDENKAHQLGVVCFMYRQDKEARLAMRSYNQSVKELIAEIKEQHDNLLIGLYLTSEASINAAWELYSRLPKIIKQVDDVTILEKDISSIAIADDNINGLSTRLKKASTTEILSLIIASAIKVEASDIHIEAEENKIQLRFRIDGVLHTVADMERLVYEKLISRVKLNSKLKINVKDKPQDGNFSVHIAGKEIDFRVSSLPTSYGESIVMRVLYHDKVKGFTLDKLGIEQYYADLLQREINRPNGMIIVTGPTGSGKTTTLYAILNKLNTENNKIITIEDPIEYKIEGINQSEVKPARDYTFSKGLRSIVRQDPDIILVGEIRDTETAEIALNAALTGHLVFSTLHTNDAVGAIPRLLALGAKTYLLAPALNIIVAQRLVRRLCPECRQAMIPASEEQNRVNDEILAWPDKYRHFLPAAGLVHELKFYRSHGCSACHGLGYRGQVAIFEIFVVTDQVKEIILSSGMSELKLKEIARDNGMISMAQDGILKAASGITSLEEIFRVA